MNNCKLIIFDWDGTIMDSSARIVSSMQNASESLSLSVPSALAVRNIIGLSLDVAIPQIVPSISDADIKRLTQAYSKHYVELDQTPTYLYEGVEDTLTNLKNKGYMLAIATGKSRKGLDRVLAQTQLDKLIDIPKGADEANSKPDPLMLIQILEQANIKVHDAIMIGDTSYDLEMAQRAQMPSIGVSYGMHETTLLKKYSPLVIVDRFPQIEEWLDSKLESKSE
ncbi:MAG: HAD-IA family hydrolase [Oceanospirillaceae bacterium]